MEIERKWLLDAGKIPYDLQVLPSYSIEQAYVSFSPTIRIRKINGGEGYILTVKTKPADNAAAELAREEYEMPLNEEEYNSLLEISRGTVIEKTRYVARNEAGYTEEIDIFSGALEGLAFMEIEFESVEEAQGYRTPDWVTCDVTYDSRYKNACLAKYGRPQSL